MSTDDTTDQAAAFLIDDRLKTHRKLGAGVTLVTQSPNDALGMKDAPNQTALKRGVLRRIAVMLWCIAVLLVASVILMMATVYLKVMS